MLDDFGTTMLAGYRLAECRATAEELRLLRDVQSGRGRRTGLSLGEIVRDGITALARSLVDKSANRRQVGLKRDDVSPK